LVPSRLDEDHVTVDLDLESR